MKDEHWRAVHEALQPILTPADVLLAPRGGWAAFPCRLRQYDAAIEPAEATVLVLHKGRLPAIRKSSLAKVMAEWGCVFANDVFVVFAKSRKSRLDARCGRTWMHLRRVRAYLKSRELKRRASTIFYVHLPKTGGTTLWVSLSKAFRSSVYYGDVHTFLHNPPARGEYDLVGVHFGPAWLDGVLSPDDEMIGLLREPTARFLSGVAHSRRLREDPATFSPSQRAMREMRLTEFVRTDYARYEARAQLIELGRAERGMVPDDQMLLARALDFLGRDGALIAPSEQSETLMTRLERRLGLRLPRVEPLNVNDPADYALYAEEFDEARPAIEFLNAGERRLYAAARTRFERA